MMSISDAVRTHRLDYWTWVERHAVEPERSALVRLRRHWHDVNAKHFDAVMVEPYITLTEPSTPSLYGQCCPVSSWGSRLEIKLRPSLLTGTHPHMAGPAEGRYLFVADVLTHEMCHQFHMEHTGTREESYHGHGPAFTATANAVGAALELPAVVVRNRKGSSDARAANWPHNVRDAAYYLGAYQPRARVPGSGDTTPCPHCEGTGRITRQETQP